MAFRKNAHCDSIKHSDLVLKNKALDNKVHDNKEYNTMKFNPCTGRCTDEGTHCEGCGRSHEEIKENKVLVTQLVNFARAQGYENSEDFAESMRKNILYQLQNPK